MESKRKGWIKIHRTLIDNPYMAKPAYIAVWIRLLIEAKHKDETRKIIWKGKQLTLKNGQFTCGTKQLAKWSGVPRGTVVRVLSTFKNEQMIEHQTSSKFSLITINNWKEYQESEHQNEQRVNNQRTTSEQPADTLEEYNNTIIEEEGKISPTAKEICKILKIRGQGMIEAVDGQVNRQCNLKKDSIGVAYKIAIKVEKLPEDQRYFTFTTWLDREMTDARKDSLKPKGKDDEPRREMTMKEILAL